MNFLMQFLCLLCKYVQFLKNVDVKEDNYSFIVEICVKKLSSLLLMKLLN